MIHPDHGTHFAYGSNQVEECVKNGWKVEDEKVKPVTEPVLETVAPVTEIQDNKCPKCGGTFKNLGAHARFCKR